MIAATEKTSFFSLRNVPLWASVGLALVLVGLAAAVR